MSCACVHPSHTIPPQNPAQHSFPDYSKTHFGAKMCKFTFKAPSHCPTSVTAGPGTNPAGTSKAQRGHFTAHNQFIFTTEAINLGADCNKYQNLQEVQVQENTKCYKMKIRGFNPTHEHFLLEMPQMTELAEQHIKAPRVFKRHGHELGTFSDVPQPIYLVISRAPGRQTGPKLNKPVKNPV